LTKNDLVARAPAITNILTEHTSRQAYVKYFF
jgi:hypothetical protein